MSNYKANMYQIWIDMKPVDITKIQQTIMTVGHLLNNVVEKLAPTSLK